MSNAVRDIEATQQSSIEFFWLEMAKITELNELNCSVHVLKRVFLSEM